MMGERDTLDDLACLFCHEAYQFVVYWLPDSSPAVCHVACRQCGGSGPWEESETAAIASYDEPQQSVRRLIKAIQEAYEQIERGGGE
jgi:hypothetical protein